MEGLIAQGVPVRFVLLLGVCNEVDMYFVFSDDCFIYRHFMNIMYSFYV